MLCYGIGPALISTDGFGLFLACRIEVWGLSRFVALKNSFARGVLFVEFLLLIGSLCCGHSWGLIGGFELRD